MSSLPKMWTRRTIGSLCELINGRAFRPGDWTEQGLPIVRIQNLNDSGAPFNRFDGEVRSRFLIDSGALLFAWSGTPGTSFGAHIWTGGTAVLNQHIFNVVFDEKVIDKHFFRLAINQKLEELIDKAHGGVGLRHVTKGKFEATEIALPPLHEQCRIVSKVEKLFSRSSMARCELDRIPRLIERYRLSVLAAAFRGELTDNWRRLNPNARSTCAGGEAFSGRKRREKEQGFEPPYAVPESWRWAALSKLGALDRGRSRHRPRNAPELYGGSCPFIQTGDVKAAQGRLTTFSQTYSEAGLAQSRLWPKGTLCITIAANIAETAILGIDACFPDSIVGFIAKAEVCNPLFIEFFIRTVKGDLAAFAPATAQKNINLETLHGLNVPCPPLEEQNEIIRSIEAAFARIDQAAAEAVRATSLLSRLEQAILDKAFRGELLPSGETALHPRMTTTTDPQQAGYETLLEGDKAR